MAPHPHAKATALVVSDDSGLREDVARWLDDDGLQVMICPGPRAPLFSCVGLRGELCPLLGVADIVLLDLHPEPGELLERSGRLDLVEHYRGHGKTLLALVDEEGAHGIPGIEGVAMVGRHADRGQVLASVQELLGSARP